ncbi:DUF2993 domain-containing protein [Rhodococcus sp. NPDC058521]|uniref:LmeA family phospholipid-binding protein n=1 Tax=Rhodococcus sp. NPDC058521 TaxID=3346536 RepID=UPI003648ACE3
MSARTNSSSGRNRVLLIVMLVVAALVLALIAGELFVRHQVKSCMANQFESQLGSQVDVGLSWKPVLLQSIDKEVPYVTIDSDDSAFGPAQQMEVHARVNDIRIEETPESNGTIGSSEADIHWTTQGILATLQEQTFGSLISDVKADSGAGTLTFAVGPAGLADMTVKPTVENGTVKVETVGAAILGFGLPTDLVDGIVQTLTDSLQNYPLGMVPESLTVSDDAIDIALRGGAYTMPAADPNQPQPQESGCGVLV